MEDLITLADILDVTGKILIAYTAIRVHERVRKEHKIDDVVFISMKREQTLGIIGILLLISGFTVRIAVRYLL